MASIAVLIPGPEQAEERHKRGNIATREEIDKAANCDEIVGSSAALERVLSLIAKGAPTDATVLITGETGTGVPRAIQAVSVKRHLEWLSH
jgi:transcriptional regulator with PAS, ATPase and Fis domain